jgi:hypothetical protein
VMRLIASSVNRSNVDDLFPGCVREPSPGKTEQTKRNEDHSEYFHSRPLVEVFRCNYASWRITTSQAYLLLKYLLNLPDFPLDLACDFFALAFGLQVGVVRHLPRFLFNVTLHFVQLPCDLIFRARFHECSCSTNSQHL